ncbi:hypothetical protein [Mucilaginibacter sp.]|uniref:hypothetical protein n=1 Tax=Mucilaginibacter sp. TaxID=1882438 RepID=UPI0026002E85|nr:hypothetical protein [Mucilaginibacter sp.]
MMKNFYLTMCVLFLLTNFCGAQQLMKTTEQSSSLEQPQPFLYTINTLNPSGRNWSVNYSGGYGEHTVTPIGFDGVDQNISVKGYLGQKFTFLATLGTGFSNNGGVHTLQQAELLRDFIGGNQPMGFRIGAGLGFRHEFNNDNVAFSRITAAYDVTSWKVGANVRLEKAFDARRDGLDIITSIGLHRHISGQFFAGVEAVGQDLEGFWQSDEAEGGARLLVGPSVNYAPSGSRFAFTLCGGPIIYATRSNFAQGQFAAYRELPANNGFTLKFNVGFRFM